jgi:hypothetical protein
MISKKKKTKGIPLRPIYRTPRYFLEGSNIILEALFVITID